MIYDAITSCMDFTAYLCWLVKEYSPLLRVQPLLENGLTSEDGNPLQMSRAVDLQMSRVVGQTGKSDGAGLGDQYWWASIYIGG